MKELKNTQSRPGAGSSFDNVLEGRMVHWMHPQKAIRTLAAVAAFAVGAGCDTTADSVPTQTVILPQTASVAVVAQAPTTDTNLVVVERKETLAPAPVTVTNTVKSTDQKPESVSTNEAPVIKEEIPPSIPQNLKVSEATEKIVKLAQGGVDETVMMAFVEKSQGRFDLEADEIVYLSDLGVPSGVLTAMLKKDGVDPSKAESLTAATNTEVNQPAPQTLPGAQPQQPPQQVVEVTTNYVPNTTIVQAQPQTVIVQQQPQTVVVTPQPETVTYFYDSLSPYGSWLVTPEYGWCWQPTVAVIDHGWRPYGHRGHWVYTTSGWYWASDYSWGWAPFHYGRWHLAGSRGWIWIPDRVWGPAWVSWRTTDDYCGWAPLPPSAIYRPGFGFSYFGSSVGVSFGFGLGVDAYCFAPIGHFHDRHVWHHSIVGYRAHNIYSRSYVHNRYDWNRDSHHVVNNGVPRQQIEKAINRELRPVQVREVPAQQTASRVGPRERIERSGRDSIIYRPSLASVDRSSGVRSTTSTVTPQATAPASSVTTSPRFNRNRSETTVRTASVPTPTPQPSTAPAPTVSTRPSVERIAQSERRDRVFGAPSPAIPTPAPAPVVTTPQPHSAPASSTTVPTSPTQNPGGRDRVRRSITETPTTIAPPPVTSPVIPPSQANRRNFDRSVGTTPTPQITTPPPQISAPPPQITAPPPRITTPPPRIVSPPPQTVAPAPRIISTPPQTVAPAPRIISPPPQSAPPARPYSPPPANPRATLPAPAQSAPRPAPPSSNPNQSRGDRRENGVANDVRNRFGR